MRQSDVEAHFDKEARRHFRFNFVIHTAEWALGTFGFACVAFDTILPMYMKSLGASYFQIALAPVMLIASFSISMLPTAYFVERRPTRTWPAVVYGIPMRFVLVIFGVTALLTSRYGPAVGLCGIFIGIALMMTTAGASEVAWRDLMSRIVPKDLRGKFHGVRNVVMVLTGALAAWLVTSMVGDGKDAPPDAFGWPFLIGAAAFACTLPLIALTREPLHPAPAERAKSYGAFMAKAVDALRNDKPFRNFIIVRMATSAIWLFPTSLFSVYAKDVFEIPTATIMGTFTVVLYASQMATGPLLGILADRRGYRVVFAGSIVCVFLATIMGLTLPWWAPYETIGFGVCFALSGMASTAAFMAIFNMTFEFADVHQRTLYIAITGTCTTPIYLAAGASGGALADLIGFPPVLAMAAALAVAGFILTLKLMPEPRHHGPAEIAMPIEGPTS